MNILLVITGLTAGVTVASLWWKARTAAGSARLAGTEELARKQAAEIVELRATLHATGEERSRLQAELEAECRLSVQQTEIFEKAKEQLTAQFSAMSAEALERNNRSFLDLAASSMDAAQTKARSEFEQRTQSVEAMVKPLQDSLQRVDEQLHALEIARGNAYTSLAEQVRSLGESQERLRSETSNLVTALRAPHVRGRWGEMQLRKVVEAAGMVRNCDFSEQVTAVGEDGTCRPDLIVHLPGAKQIVVDAKVPLSAYLEAYEAEDVAVQAERLGAHARQVRTHIDSLSSKSYWEQFENTPDFVVLFIPGDPFMAAACEQDAALFEYAAQRRVVLATPTTLITLLQSVAYGWRQDALAENARAICETGKKLYDRLCTMSGHIANVGKHLDKAVDAYNRQVGALETRVMVSARELANLEVSDKELETPAPVEHQARALQAAELVRLTPVEDHEDNKAVS